MRLDIAALSRAGARERNEDAFGVWSDGGVSYCVLADGAGGLGGGDRASQLAVASVLDFLRARPGFSSDTLHAALAHANAQVVAAQQAEKDLADMRTTIVLLAVDSTQRRALWGHAGDARLYWFRDRTILHQTADHSVVQQMVEAGYMRVDELRQAPQRSRLTLAVGDPGDFEPAMANEVEFDADDAFLLCTDGCWGPIEETVMMNGLQSANGAADWLERLHAHIVALGDPHQDNYSAIAVRCDADPTTA